MGVARILEDRVSPVAEFLDSPARPIAVPHGPVQLSAVEWVGAVEVSARSSAVALREVAHQLASCSLDLIDLLGERLLQCCDEVHHCQIVPHLVTEEAHDGRGPSTVLGNPLIGVNDCGLLGDAHAAVGLLPLLPRAEPREYFGERLGCCTE